MKVDVHYCRLTNGETLAYREREGGEIPCLFIHGNMTSSIHWDVLLQRMDKKYKLYAIDLRGFGESTYHKPIQSIKDFADDLRLFVDEIGLASFFLMGWSMGGAVAMQFCADHPSYCQKLILLASASTRGYPHLGITADSVEKKYKRLYTLEDIKADESKTIPVQKAYETKDYAWLKALWDQVIYVHTKPSEKRYETYLRDMTTQRNLAEVYHALNHYNLSNEHNGITDGTNQVKDIHIPVLILRGEDDLVVTQEMTNEIIEDFAGKALFRGLAHCGHSPLIDDLDTLVKELEQFIGKVHVS